MGMHTQQQHIPPIPLMNHSLHDYNMTFVQSAKYPLVFKYLCKVLFMSLWCTCVCCACIDVCVCLCSHVYSRFEVAALNEHISTTHLSTPWKAFTSETACVTSRNNVSKYWNLFTFCYVQMNADNRFGVHGCWSCILFFSGQLLKNSKWWSWIRYVIYIDNVWNVPIWKHWLSRVCLVICLIW